MARNSLSGGVSGLLRLLAILVGVLSPIIYLLDKNIESFYIFEPGNLHDLAKRGIHAHGNDTKGVVKYIVDELGGRADTSRYINHDEEWILNNAGGAMGGMYILHASVTEYLIIFGTAVGTEGHTGRHTADDYFHILYGTQTAYVAGKYEPEVYTQGSVHHLRRGDAKQYKMAGSCFALEYARGWIPPMFLFGVADSFTSTFDLITLWRTVYVSAREILGNLLKGKF